jgi:hypothetical protein
MKENCCFLFDSLELNVNTYLELCMGVKRHPYKYLIPLTIIHCLMFITGITGNMTGNLRNIWFCDKHETFLNKGLPCCNVFKLSYGFFFNMLAIQELYLQNIFVAESTVFCVRQSFTEIGFKTAMSVCTLWRKPLSWFRPFDTVYFLAHFCEVLFSAKWSSNSKVTNLPVKLKNSDLILS